MARLTAGGSLPGDVDERFPDKVITSKGKQQQAHAKLMIAIVIVQPMQNIFEVFKRGTQFVVMKAGTKNLTIPRLQFCALSSAQAYLLLQKPGNDMRDTAAAPRAGRRRDVTPWG